jgi:hypothetical protein
VILLEEKNVKTSEKFESYNFYTELELPLYMPNFMQNAHIRGFKCLHFDRKKVGLKYNDNIKRFFGTILNFYTTNEWKLVIPSLLAFFLALFDQYSDIKYVANTEFNE